MLLFFLYLLPMKALYLIFALCLSGFHIQGQVFDFNSNCRDAYRQIIELKFNEAEKRILQEKQMHPENLMTIYLENYIDFLKVIIGEKEEEFRELERKKSVRLNKIGQGPESSPFLLYCEANINLQWAIARIKFEEYFTAFFEINRAYKKLEKNRELFPGFYPNMIGLGLLHTMIGTVPDNYKWITKIIGLDGNVKVGMHELTTFIAAAEENKQYRIFIPEGLFFLSFMQMNLETDDSASRKIEEKIRQLDMESPLLIFVLSDHYQKEARNEDLLKVLEQYQIQHGTYPFNYLIYMRGLARLRKLDSAAIKDFEFYLRNFKGSSYKASARQKIAWLLLLQGDTLAYQQTIKQALDDPESIIGGDEYAKKEARNGHIPDTGLLKARILFDGGYYQRSVTVLDSIRPENEAPSFLAEYFYRYGRNYQELKEYKKALGYFKQCIQVGEELNSYYAANAALQSGIIYENTGQTAAARNHYNQCLEMDFDEYEWSIRHKAKARLNKLQ